MDLEIIIPSEVNQRKTNVIGYHLHVEILSNTKELFLQNRNRPTDLGNKPLLLKGKGWGEG